MHLFLALTACTTTPETPPEQAPAPAASSGPERLPNGRIKGKVYSLDFGPLEVTDDHLKATEPTAVDHAIVGLDKHDIAFHTIYKRGDAGFGDRYTLSGEPIEEACNNQDYNALFQAKGALWLTSHFECTPGEIYLTRLAQDDAGLLTPEMNTRVDFKDHNGLWNPCAGMITPWGTHLSSEEYEPDASRVPTEDGWDFRAWDGMEKTYLDGKKLNPYDYGWTPEVAVLSVQGDALAVKHKSMGRFSHEIALVMPDERTVYLTDDGRAGGFYMYVADEKANLSKGNLYAARYTQESAEAGGRGKIEWIPLGWSDDAYIDGLIKVGVTFDDLMVRKDAKSREDCAEKQVFVKTDGSSECIGIQPNSDKVQNVAIAASRLETRRYAAYLGATTEFEKGEGLAFDPERKVLYASFAKIAGRMVEEDNSTIDHIRLPKNDCGAVWSGPMKDKRTDLLGNPIVSDWVLTSMSNLVSGKAQPADERGNTCVENGIANPDNLAYLPHYRTLVIAEDTSKHTVASLWSLNTERARLERMMIAPPHAEFTGITWSPNLNGHGYLTVAIQHPWRAETLEDTKLPEGITPDHQRSITGYLGPFPPLD